MKINYFFLILQTICMYLTQLPLWGILYFAIFDRESKLGIYLSDLFGLIFRIGTLICVAVSIVHLIVTLIRRKNIDFSKMTMISKIVLIPWYVINYFFCAMTFIGLCNPFFFIAAPIFLLISVLSTYLYMLSTSLPEFIAYSKTIIKKEKPASFLGVFSCISLFFFVFDLAGSILIYHLSKNQQIYDK